MASPYNTTDEMNSQSEASMGDSSRRSASAQGSNQSSAQGSGVDVLRGTLTNAFDQIVKEIEPQISEFATNFAHQAMDKGADYGRQAVQRVQKQSWGRIGLAAALIVGAVAVLGYTAAEVADQDSLH